MMEYKMKNSNSRQRMAEFLSRNKRKSKPGSSRVSTGKQAARPTSRVSTGKKVPSSGRRGYATHAPYALKTLAPPKSKPVREEMEEFCQPLGVPIDWQQFGDDDELRGLADREMLLAAGCPPKRVVRVLAKLRAVLAREQA